MSTPSPDSGSSSRLWSVYLWALSFLKPYWRTFALLVLTTSLVSGIELAVPKFIQHFLDVLLPSRDRSGYYWLTALLGAAFAVRIGAEMLQNLLGRSVQERAARDLQHAIFRHLRKLGFAHFERTPVGQTLSFLNTEVAAIQTMYRQGFPWMIDGLIFSVLSLAMMASTHVGLTLIVLPGLLLYYIFGPSLERKASLSGKEMAANRVAENQKVYESVSAAAELRAFSAERWDLSRYEEKVAAFNRSMIRTYWFAYWRGTNRRLSYFAGAIVLFIYGYWLINQGALSVGAFISFLLYYFTAMHRLTSVITNITEQKVLMYQAERLYRFMRTEPTVPEPDRPLPLPEVRGEIRFEDVRFQYEDGQPVLNGLTLTIQPGQRVALVGESGCGKSTALKLIGRFYDPEEGRILLDGVPIDRLAFGTLRGPLGYVFQETYLYGASVKENIRFGRPEATDEEVIEAAKAAYAHPFIQELPDGYDTLVGERGVRLSGGQKQRIAIARMFVKNPSVVLLDEATSALDNASEHEVQQALDRLFIGRTVVAVAHRLSTVSQFDAIAVLKRGRVAQFGTYAELSGTDGPFRRLLEGREERKEALHV
ncbi:ABC transporter ATP-binding protein [Paenibacillus sp. J31TS4]|uniref:ABC transporter ATP-binding protein n=1 Tax=Paenibacillus sp. J31TS4 TaxID=2807195 RepID=UPI001B295134|nr:ABC transporter ATP-binding protein [Paenibacillus sp. J31TS4]GIP39069.1 ABC transporter ATP-binding protein [Paenibacillus sp. J31TS4]